MSLTTHLQQYLPEPRQCFHHNRDQNIPDQLRRHAIGIVIEFGVNEKEYSSWSRAHITTSHLGEESTQAASLPLQASYVDRTSLPSTSVVRDFSRNRSQQTAVKHTGATNPYAHTLQRYNRWKHEHRVPDDPCGWGNGLAGSCRQCD